MPECTNQEDIKLIQRFTLDGGSFIDTFSKPILNANVPMVDFFTDVDAGLENPWIDRVYSMEGCSVKAYSRCVDCSHTHFPSEVVFAS